ncbi:Unknown protein, partial [Striga hermonthica]
SRTTEAAIVDNFFLFFYSNIRKYGTCNFKFYFDRLITKSFYIYIDLKNNVTYLLVLY